MEAQVKIAGWEKPLKSKEGIYLSLKIEVTQEGTTKTLFANLFRNVKAEGKQPQWITIDKQSNKGFTQQAEPPTDEDQTELPF